MVRIDRHGQFSAHIVDDSLCSLSLKDLQACAKRSHCWIQTVADRAANFPAVTTHVRNGVLIARRHASNGMRHGIKPRKPPTLNIIRHVGVFDIVTLRDACVRTRPVDLSLVMKQTSIFSYRYSRGIVEIDVGGLLHERRRTTCENFYRTPTTSKEQISYR